MSYAIICDARKGQNLGVEILALVDRSKSRKYWWTSDAPCIAINYRSLSAATFACNRLCKNNARIVDHSKAVEMLNQQARMIDLLSEDIDDFDPSWDAHKDSF